MATSSVGFENFFSTTLNGAISDSDLTINLNAVPTPSEGFLVIEPDNASKREVIYYTSKGASSVTCPSGAGNGRGYDGTSATSHSDGATVIMAPVAAMFEALQDMSAIADGTVDTALIADGAVTNAKLDTTAGELGGAWQSFTPTYDDMTLGNGTAEHKYTQIGKTVICMGYITFGSTTTVDSVSVGISLPVAAAGIQDNAPIGIWRAKDVSPSGQYNGFVQYFDLSGDYAFFDAEDASGTYSKAASMSSTAPITWATGDQILYQFTYEAA